MEQTIFHSAIRKMSRVVGSSKEPLVQQKTVKKNILDEKTANEKFLEIKLKVKAFLVNNRLFLEKKISAPKETIMKVVRVTVIQQYSYDVEIVTFAQKHAFFWSPGHKKAS